MEIKCPICGRKFVRGYWDHYEACSKRRQAELDNEWEKRKLPTKKIHNIYDVYTQGRPKYQSKGSRILA